MKILCVDYGDSRTGLAISDEGEILASPLETLFMHDFDRCVALVGEAARQNKAKLIVVGDPININGTRGERSEKCRFFAQKLREIVDIPVTMWDERSSTVTAIGYMNEINKRGKKRKAVLDQAAAAVILDTFLTYRKNNPDKIIIDVKAEERKMYTVSFTGHRPEKLNFFGEDDPMCKELKRRLSDEIEKLIKDGAEMFCTGMALGVDTWAAEALLELQKTYSQIKLTAVIPCPEQSQNWSEKDKARYNSILARCNKKITTSPSYSKGCMAIRNKALVDMCDILIAVFNGEKGGTMQTLNYAKSKGKKIVILENC